MILTVCSKLDPQLSEAEQFDVIKAATDSVFPLPVLTSPSKKDSVVSTLYYCPMSATHMSTSLFLWHMSNVLVKNYIPRDTQ